MSDNSELRDITQKITDIQKSQTEILTALTEQGTSLSFIKDTIKRVETDHSNSIDKLQERMQAAEMMLNSFESFVDRSEKNTDRILNPIIRKLVDYGFIALAFIIYHYANKG